MTREQARQTLRQKSDAELLKAYHATQIIEKNILQARSDHILMMCWIETFELNHQQPTDTLIKLRSCGSQSTHQ